MTEKRKAAFQGEGWQARTAAHRTELQAGQIWSSAGVQREYDPLKRVVLFAPAVDTPSAVDVNAVQHLGQIDFRGLHAEIQVLAQVYQSFGIQVDWLQPVPSLERVWHYNLFFARDLFLMTPAGAVIARMGSRVRAGEEKHIANTLAGLGVPILRTVTGQGTFEGADALWVRDDLVLVGVGNRTNPAGYDQVASCLRELEVTVKQIQLPNMIQHLLGLMQVVAEDCVILRGEIAPRALVEFLRQLGFQLVELTETEEVTTTQAMNFVTIAPRKVIMAAGNPHTKAVLEHAGIEVVAEIAVPELLKGAGGIACATGILDRR